MNGPTAGAHPAHTTWIAPTPRGGADTPCEPLPPLAQVAAGLAALPAAGRVQALWDDQRRRWLSGERTAVETYLGVLPPALAAELLLDLIYGEFVLRLEAGEAPRADEYAARFPDHREAIERQLRLHQVLSDTEAESPAAAVPPQAAAQPPREIAGYPIVSALDAGGQGQVYRAVHPTLGRDVIIKVGHRAVAPGLADALAQEGRLLAELDDPGLARVYDLRLHEGRPCLVMEYVRGVNLEQHAQLRPPAPRAAAALVARVARSLAAVHRRGVVHRDVKPRNILIDEAGNPRLIDFGVARLADAWRPEPGAERGVTGTLAYMAPEQARGEAAGPAADVFALGGVLYFLLTGHAPYPATSFTETYASALRCDWDRAALADPRVPAPLRAVVTKALALDPAARYATADAVAAALETFARPRRRWPWLAGAAAGALLAGVAAWAATRPPPAQPGPAPVVPDAKARPVSLEVRVWNSKEKRYWELSDRVPLGKAEEVRVEAVAPAGMHTALFVLSGNRLNALATAAPADEDRTISYPEGSQKSSKLVGKGNEVVLLLARRTGPAGVEELRGLVGDVAWPELPDRSVLRLTPDGVKVVQTGRDFGAPNERADPEGEVRRGLDELRRRLGGNFDHVEGLAFSHRD